MRAGLGRSLSHRIEAFRRGPPCRGDRALRSGAGRPPRRYARALCARQHGPRARAWPRPPSEFFRRVLALEPERIEALVNLANLLRETGNVAGRRRPCSHPRWPAARRRPNCGWRWARSIARRAIWAKPNAIIREALARRPDFPAALGNLADLLADAARWTRRSRSTTARSSATARMRRPGSTARSCTSSRAI